MPAEAGAPEDDVEEAPGDGGDDANAPGRPKRRRRCAERRPGNREGGREPELAQRAAEKARRGCQRQATDVVERALARDEQEQQELDERRRQLRHSRSGEMGEEVRRARHVFGLLNLIRLHSPRAPRHGTSPAARPKIAASAASGEVGRLNL